MPSRYSISQIPSKGLSIYSIIGRELLPRYPSRQKFVTVRLIEKVEQTTMASELLRRPQKRKTMISVE